MSGERVLVIDDEESIRRFLQVALSGQSYNIIEAATGKEGPTIAKAQKPDVIILDLGLPDRDQLGQLPVAVLSTKNA